MNIFATDPSYLISAQDVCDCYTNKMPLETGQMLSSAVWRYKHLLPANCLEMRYWKDDKDGKPIYREAIKGMYFNAYDSHPCTVWAGDSVENFSWLVKHGIALLMEYNKRYKKDHPSKSVIFNAPQLSRYLPGGNDSDFTSDGQTPFPRCINVPKITELTEDIHEAYKLFIAYKALTKITTTSTGKLKHEIRWKHSEEPSWLNEYKLIAKDFLLNEVK